MPPVNLLTLLPPGVSKRRYPKVLALVRGSLTQTCAWSIAGPKNMARSNLQHWVIIKLCLKRWQNWKSHVERSLVPKKHLVSKKIYLLYTQTFVGSLFIISSISAGKHAQVHFNVEFKSFCLFSCSKSSKTCVFASLRIRTSSYFPPEL